MIISATFVGNSYFKVPKGVPLLSMEENAKVDGPVAWSWYVRWNTLHYLDADLKEHEIAPYDNAEDNINWKHPEDVQMDPTGEGPESDDEEESDEEDADEEDADKWEYDNLALALNHGNCLNAGRHEKTIDEDWVLFMDTFKETGYSEEMYRRLEKRLLERDGVVPARDE